MSDLKLVAPEQPTAFERQLFAAVAKEAPSAEQRMRVRQALGLPALPLAPVLETSRRALWLKAGAGGLVVASAALFLMFSGVGRKVSPRELQPTVTAGSASNVTQSPGTAAVAPTSFETKLGVVPANGEPSAAPLPPPEAAPAVRSTVRPSARSATPSSVTDGGDLTEQLRLIDAARSAVAAGNASAASAALTSYSKRFPRGAFGQEAAVLRIQTLDLQGSHTQAAALARGFLARYPNSPHVGVVRRIAN